MRRIARVDANQPDITEGLRKVGATVQLLHIIGDGCPDMLVGYHGVNYLLEIKDGDKPPSQRQLTDDEMKWFNKWRGKCAVVNNLDEALEYIGATR